MFEQNTVVYPPNKSLERKFELSTKPVIYNHLLYIDINEKGEAIVGSGNINGTLWEGTLLYFNNTESLQTLNFSKSYIGSTVSDAKFLNENTIVLAEDTGILNVLRVNESGLISNCFFKEADRIPKLATWRNSTKTLTCSGNSLTIWDVNVPSSKPLYHFPDFHTQTVNYVDSLRTDENLFASAATDRKCCLWDARNQAPAQVIYANEFCSLTSVAFNQTNSNYIIAGTESGDVYLIDRREPKEFISVASCNCYIYRTIFDDSNKLAVCGDTNKVVVFTCEAEILNTSYCNDKHYGIVRGMAWYNEALYTCGFDKQVVKHLF